MARLLASVPAAAPKEPEPLAAPAAEGLPEVHAPAPEPAEAPEPARGTGFASAKDAIEQLMGTAPSQPIRAMRMGSRSTMDVEATLDALSDTLSGPHEAAAHGPDAPAAAPEPSAHEAAVPEAAPKSDLSSTVKLTSEEIRNAMAAALEPRPAAPMPSAPPRPSYQPPADMPGVLPGDIAAQGSNLLKIQLEQETCQNVSLEQMTTWIEQGRVLEYHMVARQYSDHWIEASKVPALRPVFDRLRKMREALAEDQPRTAPEPPPVKRGLFSGLFGRN